MLLTSLDLMRWEDAAYIYKIMYFISIIQNVIMMMVSHRTVLNSYRQKVGSMILSFSLYARPRCFLKKE